MATYLNDDALCLRVTDFSETSQIVALFTRAHGLLPLIAKGAKRASKKNTMSGPLDLLTSGEVVFVPSKGAAELGTLAAWELLDHRTELRKNLPALNAAMLCAEITTLLVHPHDPHPELYAELEAALALLPGAQRPRAAVAYAKAALLAAGYAPQLDNCLACARPVADTAVRFSVRAGGFLCGPGNGHGCSQEHAGPLTTVSGRIIAALARLPLPSALLTNPPERPADTAALATALSLLLAQIESISDKPLRTRYLLKSIFADAPSSRATAIPPPAAAVPPAAPRIAPSPETAAAPLASPPAI